MKPLFIGEQLSLTLWIGGMWIVGYLVAPVLFNMLDDRQLAGSLAGRMFTIMSYLGLVCGSFLIIGQLSQSGSGISSNWRFWLLCVMLVMIVIGQFVLQPMMSELRDAGLQGEAASTFGKLHGISSALFLFNSLAGLILVVFRLHADSASI